MKRLTILTLLAVCSAIPCALQAQSSDHVEVGAFFDYTRLSAPTPEINFVGVGGRLGFNIRPTVALEAEMSYDFARNFTSTFDDGLNIQPLSDIGNSEILALERISRRP